MDQLFSISVKDPITPLKNINKIDVHSFLQLIKTNPDLDVKVKIFSILAAYCMSNNAETDAVVTSNFIYDNLSAVLVANPPRKAPVALNLLAALLYADEERSRNNLAPYARNAIRASGCLAAMCDMFTSCMMYQDTWRALCRCLAEACRGIDDNQSYCTHLIPTCIQRSLQRHWDTFLVLQSLLQNHKRNIQLFFENNGHCLFSKDYLHHENSLELLATIVQSSNQISAHINWADLANQLQQFLCLYGPQSQIGQWSTIILYHTRTKVTTQNACHSKNMNHTNQGVADKTNITTNNDTTAFFQHVMKEIVDWKPKVNLTQIQNMLYLEDRFSNNMRTTHTACRQRPIERNYLSMDIKALQKAKENTTTATERTQSPMEHNNYTSIQMEEVKKTDDMDVSAKEMKSRNLNEMSFSFLRNLDKDRYVNKQVKNSTQCFRSIQNTGPQADTNLTESDINSVMSELYFENSLKFHDFKPQFISTPKRDKNKFNSNIGRSKQRSRTIRKPIRKYVQKPRNIKRLHNQSQEEKNDSEIKNRSISAKFFRAVNESCTTLVKTVKSIFGSNKRENKGSIEKIERSNIAACSYSFTNYMRKRDAILGDKTTQIFNTNRAAEFTLEMNSSCRTCNDTVVLKNKMANNDYLKNTVNKLKIGINLYGCDFKKISRTMWPRDAYMTPTVLYNLYRKLLRK